MRERLQNLGHRWNESAARRREERHPGTGQRERELREQSAHQLFRQPASQSAAERRFEQGPERDPHREEENNERRYSTHLDSNSRAPSDRSGSQARSSGRSGNPPRSNPPSFRTEAPAPSFRTNASTTPPPETPPPTYDHAGPFHGFIEQLEVDEELDSDDGLLEPRRGPRHGQSNTVEEIRRQEEIRRHSA